MYLTHDEARAIGARVAGIEQRTGTEVVVAVVGRTDRYPELRWKAFAIGVAFAALAVVVLDALRVEWPGGLRLLPAMVTVLAAGIANALAAQYVPRYGRAYVRHNRAEAEARQYAESLFLERGLFGTPGRRAVLLVVALFERRVVVHADVGVAARVGAGDWQRVVAPVTAGLRAGDRAGAVQAGLTALESLLADHGFVASGEPRSALPDKPVEERGP